MITVVTFGAILFYSAVIAIWGFLFGIGFWLAYRVVKPKKESTQEKETFGSPC